jgi:hypothetical protein
VQHFLATPYGGIFQLYLNSTPIAESNVGTAAELKPTTGIPGEDLKKQIARKID